MIIYCKKDEIDSILDKIEEIEQKFWLNYRNYHKTDREYLENAFDTIYKKLESMSNEEQIEMEI